MTNCPNCNRIYQGSEKFCAACGCPRPCAPRKSKKGRVILVSVLVCILTAAVIAAWRLELGPFHLNLKGVAALSMAQIEGTQAITPPSEAEAEKFAVFVKKAEQRAKSRMKRDEKATANAILELSETLAAGGQIDPKSPLWTTGQTDFGSPLWTTGQTDFGSPLWAAGQMTGQIDVSTSADLGGVSNWSGISGFLRPTAVYADTGTAPGSNPQAAAGKMLGDFIGELQEAAATQEDPPPRAPYGSWPSVRTAPPADGSILCQVCGYKNPPDTKICEDCGADLTQQGLGFTAAGPPAPPPPVPVPDPEKPVYDAATLNNIAGELMLRGYAQLPLYLSCLAAAEDPNSDAAICTIANLLKTSGDFDNALLCADYGLRLSPNSEPLLYTAGMICMKQNEVDRAAGYFSRALRASGGGGPANQGMMLVALARQDFGGAFLYMLEGGRDAFTSSVMEVYRKFKLRPDYKELSGRIFDQYTLMELMNFKRCRTAFDPTLDTVGQQLSLGRLSLPASLKDWHASAPGMFLDCADYFKGAAMLFSEEGKQLLEIYNLFEGVQDLKDLYRRFQASSFAPKQKTEAEQMVSYEQEVFWLSILNDYFDWEISKIEKKKSDAMDSSQYDDVYELIDRIIKENGDYVESLGQRMDANPMDLEALLAGLQFFIATAIDNHSPFFTAEQSATIMPRIDGAISEYSRIANECYEETRILCEEYWLYANAILGLIADDQIYNEWRQKQRHQVVISSSGYVLEAGAWAGTVCFLYEGVPMLGAGSFGGSNTGLIPKAPVLPITGKGATPYALMYGDIYVPNIAEVTKQVLGLTPDEITGAIGESFDWDNFHEGNVRFDTWWSTLSPEEKVKWQAFKANPYLINGAFTIDATGKITAEYTINEKYQNSGNNLVAPTEFSINTPIAGFSADSQTGNFSVKILNAAGIQSSPDAVTVYVAPGPSLPFSVEGQIPGTSTSIGIDAGSEFGAFGTYDKRRGQWTSGGLKAGVNMRIGNLVGGYGQVNYDVVTGLSESDIGVIWRGEEISVSGFIPKLF